MLSKGFFRTTSRSERPSFFRICSPGVIRIRGADDDLDVGLELPDACGRFDPVHARRHAHVDEGHCVRANWPRTPGAPSPHPPSPAALELQLEARLHGLVVAAPEQHALGLGERSVAAPARAQDLAEIVVNRRVVVDDEHAAVAVGMSRDAGHNAADV